MVTASALSPAELVVERKKMMFDYLGYQPGAIQAEFHYDSHVIRMLFGGDGSGKSLAAARDLQGNFFGELYWLVAADYERTRAEFNYLQESMAQLGLLKSYTKGVNPGEIVFEGKVGDLLLRGKIVTKSAKDPLTLVMEAPDGIMILEASQVDYETYLRCLGRIKRKDGSWLVLVGTPEGSLGWYAEKFTYWQTENIEGAKSFSMPSWTNLAMYPGGREDSKIKFLEDNLTHERFMERHGAEPCPPSGMVFPEFKVTIHMNDEIARLDLNKNVLVRADPGYKGTCAIEVIQVRDDNTILLVDEIYESRLTTQESINVAKIKPWWKLIESVIVDVEAPEAIAIWQSNVGVAVLGQKVPIEAGINRFRDFLRINAITGKPQFYVNSKCRGFISENGGCVNPITNQPQVYRHKVRSDNQKDAKPIDENNHATKAIIYGVVNQFGYSSEGIARTAKVQDLSHLHRREQTKRHRRL